MRRTIPLTLVMMPGARLQMRWAVYRGDLFDRASVERLAERLERLLEGLFGGGLSFRCRAVAEWDRSSEFWGASTDPRRLERLRLRVLKHRICRSCSKGRWSGARMRWR